MKHTNIKPNECNCSSNIIDRDVKCICITCKYRDMISLSKICKCEYLKYSLVWRNKKYIDDSCEGMYEKDWIRSLKYKGHIK